MVILACGTLPSSSDGRFFALPCALTPYHGKPLIEHWWECLTSAGYASTTHVFVATNAVHYKYFEFWALGKGIPIAHIINTGRSLGDTRVDLRSVAQCVRAASGAVGHVVTSALVIAADSAPPHTGAAFRATLTSLARSETSALLLQAPHGAASSGSPPPVGDGPVIRVYHTPLTSDVPMSPPAAAAARPTIEGSFDAARDAVLDVKISVDSGSHASTGVSMDDSVLSSFSPILYYVTAADVTAITSAAVMKELLAWCAALEGVTAATPGAVGGHTEAAAVPVIPLEAGMSWLARHRTVHGLRLREKFQVGAADGSAHGLAGEDPQAAAAAATSAAGVTRMESRRGSLGMSPSVSPAFLAMRALVHTVAHARVGLLGNPSDGFCGKTMSVTIHNFRAEVLLSPASDASITLIPHTVYDAATFANLRHISTVAAREGYNGGLRLMAAALHRFFLHCRTRGVDLADRGFSARYHTTVPKQVGLAGSSAIVTAFVRALMKFYGFGSEEKASSIGLSRNELPNFVLAIESEELGITAGLQDRVVQAYEGAVHMNFDKELLRTQGYGTYTKVPVAALPPLFLAYAADPSDSGRIHAPIKQRWLAGDVEVVEGMQRIADNADAGLTLARTRAYDAAATASEKEEIVHAWARLFFANFEGRRKLFGDGALGKDNIRMVEIARETGASGKFPGSGGAIVGVVDVTGIEAAGKLPAFAPALNAAAPPEEQARIAAARVAAATEALRNAYLAEGYVFTRLQPHEA